MATKKEDEANFEKDDQSNELEEPMHTMWTWCSAPHAVQVYWAGLGVEDPADLATLYMRAEEVQACLTSSGFGRVAVARGVVAWRDAPRAQRARATPPQAELAASSSRSCSTLDTQLGMLPPPLPENDQAS